MRISVSKSDIAWSYVAQFFNVGSGLITLPVILHMLSTDEIALNYLMITISTIVGLFDFGFAPQFSRNISYVFAGAQEIKKEGIAETTDSINMRLLAGMIGVAKMVYARIALVALVSMLTAGTYYIYIVTEEFSKVENALLIWIIYSFSVYFNLYFIYYGSLLMGKGLIKESKKAMLIQRVTGIAITFGLLFAGCGLLSVVISNLIAPFAGRIISIRYFYSTEMKAELARNRVRKAEKMELFRKLWYNSKKFGLVMIGSYAINKLGMFFAGLYLSLEAVASYGLMIQLMTIITTISMTFQTSFWPQMASLRAEGDKAALMDKFALTMNVFYVLFIIGCACLIFIAPPLLKLIGSNAVLPGITVLIAYSIVTLLENNHSSFASLILTDNKVPFMESSLICGALICVGSWMVLFFTDYGILGLVLVQGLVQLAYSNWKWPYVVCKEFKISFFKFLSIGFNESIYKIRTYGR